MITSQQNVTAANANIIDSVNQLRYFLSTAHLNWASNQTLKRFQMPNGETISCVYWKNTFYITGTDIVRSLVFRFQAYGRPVKNMKKFEEGIFSDLRNLKPGVDAVLEEPRSEFLEMLYKNNCIRTQKKQKVFYWFSVPHDRLFLDALERDHKRESEGKEPSTISLPTPPLLEAMAMNPQTKIPATLKSYSTSGQQVNMINNNMNNMPNGMNMTMGLSMNHMNNNGMQENMGNMNSLNMAVTVSPMCHMNANVNVGQLTSPISAHPQVDNSQAAGNYYVSSQSNTNGRPQLQPINTSINICAPSKSIQLNYPQNIIQTPTSSYPMSAQPGSANPSMSGQNQQGQMIQLVTQSMPTPVNQVAMPQQNTIQGQAPMYATQNTVQGGWNVNTPQGQMNQPVYQQTSSCQASPIYSSGTNSPYLVQTPTSSTSSGMGPMMSPMNGQVMNNGQMLTPTSIHSNDSSGMMNANYQVSPSSSQASYNGNVYQTNGTMGGISQEQSSPLYSSNASAGMMNMGQTPMNGGYVYTTPNFQDGLGPTENWQNGSTPAAKNSMTMNFQNKVTLEGLNMSNVSTNANGEIVFEETGEYVKNEKEDQVYVCEVKGCGRRFKKMEFLRRHQRCHSKSDVGNYERHSLSRQPSFLCSSVSSQNSEENTKPITFNPAAVSAATHMPSPPTNELNYMNQAVNGPSPIYTQTSTTNNITPTSTTSSFQETEYQEDKINSTLSTPQSVTSTQSLNLQTLPLNSGMSNTTSNLSSCQTISNNGPILFPTIQDGQFVEQTTTTGNSLCQIPSPPLQYTNQYTNLTNNTVYSTTTPIY